MLNQLNHIYDVASKSGVTIGYNKAEFTAIGLETLPPKVITVDVRICFGNTAAKYDPSRKIARFLDSALNAGRIIRCYDFQDDNTPRWRDGVKMIGWQMHSSKIFFDIAKANIITDDMIGELAFITPQTNANHDPFYIDDAHIGVIEL